MYDIMIILEIPDMIDLYMYFRSVDRSKTYEIPKDELTSDTTFEDIRDRLLKQYYPNGDKTLVFVFAGRTLDFKQTLTQANVDPDDTIIMVVRNAPAPSTPPAPSMQSAPQSQSQPQPQSQYQPQPQPQPQTQTQRYVIGDGSSCAYEKTYTGADIKEAMKKSTDLLLDVMHLIGHSNPFFLSYIATNPVMAREHINTTLDSPEFKLVVKAESVTEDPIKPFLTHPSGSNGHEIDMRNIRYIMKDTDVVESEESLAKAKELYLLHDRDIQRTFDAINNPDNMLIVPSSNAQSAT